MITELEVYEIRLDGGTQPREVLDQEAITDYLLDMERGAVFPPVDVFFDGEVYWLAHGFHRLLAVQRLQAISSPRTVKKITCEIHQGTQQDAQWFSCGANQTNGLRRTNADKQRAVKAAVLHPNGLKFSDREIAEHVGVDDKTVAAWREKLRPSSEIPKIRSVTRKGRTYKQDTSKIGKGRKSANENRQTEVKQTPEAEKNGSELWRSIMTDEWKLGQPPDHEWFHEWIHRRWMKESWPSSHSTPKAASTPVMKRAPSVKSKRISVKEALAEAKKRWGKSAHVEIDRHPMKPDRTHTVGEQRGLIFMAWGTGASFEEAFRDAESNPAARKPKGV